MSDAIIIPANYTGWNFENEGKDKLLIEYLPSAETADFMLEYELNITMTWKVAKDAGVFDTSDEVGEGSD